MLFFFSQSSKADDCGRNRFNNEIYLTERIIGGNSTMAGEVPWMVSVLFWERLKNYCLPHSSFNEKLGRFSKVAVRQTSDCDTFGRHNADYTLSW